MSLLNKILITSLMSLQPRSPIMRMKEHLLPATLSEEKLKTLIASVHTAAQTGK